MARKTAEWLCNECGTRSSKWMGRCPRCKAWESFVEDTPVEAPTTRVSAVAITDVAVDRGGEIRTRTGLGELDNVLGGGLVSGSLVLLGGDPGVGKSTLLLMAAHHFAKRELPVLYASGEESARQIRLRAERLGALSDSLLLLPTTDFSAIEAACREVQPLVCVIDSVQTVTVPGQPGLPGGVTQVREVAHRAMQLAKNSHTAVLLVGHVTKSGDLAGPKVLEHFVDTVLQFEGDGRTSIRVLRAVKNRFGPAGELGMFEMVDSGLKEVPDASARLLEERRPDAPGTAVVPTLEGSRALLTEVQALVGPSMPATPARTCVGVDRTRVQMLAAVLEKRGLRLSDRDLYVNAAGGVRLTEPAADLGILAATASSLLDIPLPAHTGWLGEVGLVGEIRAAPHPAMRLRELVRHGFRTVVGPPRCREHLPEGLTLQPATTVAEVLEFIAP